jgi:hypothetical protein
MPRPRWRQISQPCNNIIKGMIAVPMLDGRYASCQGLLEELVDRARNFDRIVTRIGSKQSPPHQSVDFRLQYLECDATTPIVLPLAVPAHAFGGGRDRRVGDGHWFSPAVCAAGVLSKGMPFVESALSVRISRKTFLSESGSGVSHGHKFRRGCLRRWGASPRVWPMGQKTLVLRQHVGPTSDRP